MKTITITEKNRYGGRWIITKTDRYYFPYNTPIDTLYQSLIDEEGPDTAGLNQDDNLGRDNNVGMH